MILNLCFDMILHAAFDMTTSVSLDMTPNLGINMTTNVGFHMTTNVGRNITTNVVQFLVGVLFPIPFWSAAQVWPMLPILAHLGSILAFLGPMLEPR